MTEEHVKVDEYDKSILSKYIDFIAESARTPDDDPTLEVATVFDNVTLDNFMIKIFEVFQDIKDSGSIEGYIEQGNFVISTKVQTH